MVVEPIEALCPELPVVRHPEVDFPERTRGKLAGPSLGIAAANDEPGTLKNLQVPCQSGAADGEGPPKLVDGSLALQQLGEDSATNRVGERRECCVETRHYLTIMLINDFVK